MILTLYRLNMTALSNSVLQRGGARKQAGPVKTVLLALLFAYLAASFMVLFGILFKPLLDAFFDMGLGWLYFAMYAAVTFAVGVVGTVFAASAQVFGARDNEALLSLPIRPGHILASRILVLLTVETALSLLIVLPVAYLWVAGGYATAPGALMLALGFVLMPLLGLSVSLLLAWLISLLGARMRHKNVLTIVLSVGFLVAYFYVYANIQRYLGDLILHGEDLAAAFSSVAPPFYQFGVAVAEGDAARFALFALWAVVPFVVVSLLLSAGYLRILTTNRGARRVEYRRRNLRASGATLALTRKELALYWSRPAVVLNASIGSVMMLIGAGALLLNMSDVGGYLDALVATVPGVSVAGISAVALAAIASTNNLSASLVSLEGQSFWIAKSLPVRPMAVIQAKINAHLVVSSLPGLAAAVLLGSALAETASDWLVIVLVPQAFMLFLAVAGVAINLALPRLDWTNEVQVVKQSASAMAALFGAMGVVAGLAVVYVWLFDGLVALDAYLWVCAGACVAGAGAVYVHLQRGGVARLAELPA